jgi:flagellar biosynthesis protein FlhF
MILKAYSGRTVGEALAKVKADLGDQALLVETRPLKQPGLFGGHAGYEIVAARDDRPATAPSADRLSNELAAIHSELSRLTGAQRPTYAHLGALREELDASEFPSELLGELDAALAGATDPRATLRSALARHLPCAAGIDWTATRHLLLVGPTGVGKTTTLAKIAGDLVLNHGKRLGVITLDTYRVGAQDQLRAYADLLDVPFRVASTPQELVQALVGFATLDHVLIDTAGRSPADSARVHELRGCCRAVAAAGQPLAVALAIAGSAGRAEFAQAVERFSLTDFRHLIITKLDECAAPGRLYGCLRRHCLAPCWFTTGQEVPRDLVLAHADLLAERVVPR